MQAPPSQGPAHQVSWILDLELLWQELPWDSCVVYLPMLIELRECVGLVTISGVITPPYHSTYLH